MKTSHKDTSDLLRFADESGDAKKGIEGCKCSAEEEGY